MKIYREFYGKDGKDGQSLCNAHHNDKEGGTDWKRLELTWHYVEKWAEETPNYPWHALNFQ